jgi:hypothetical protein
VEKAKDTIKTRLAWKMNMRSTITVVLATVIAVANADMYMHNMRGSNNRLDEANRDRNNANRCAHSCDFGCL